MNPTKMARDKVKENLWRLKRNSQEYFELRGHYESLVEAYFNETRINNSIKNMQNEKKQ